MLRYRDGLGPLKFRIMRDAALEDGDADGVMYAERCAELWERVPEEWELERAPRDIWSRFRELMGLQDFITASEIADLINAPPPVMTMTGLRVLYPNGLPPEHIVP